jgi:HEAT repeat protein
MKPPSKASLIAALLLSAVAVTTTAAQQNPSPDAGPDTSPDALAQAINNVETIATAKDPDQIPALAAEFSRTSNPSLKAKIASVLLRLGNKDDQYWDFLIKQATSVLDNDAPLYLAFDADGNESHQQPSQEFINWTTTHHVPLQQAIEDQAFHYPFLILDIASIGDPRAIPILRRALLSPSPLIQSPAALGLAELKDKDSIPLIIEACKRAPSSAAGIIAIPLVYFDDPAAQSAFDQYVPKGMADAYRQTAATGQGPFGEQHFR